MLKERKSGMWRPCAWLVTGLVTLGSAGQAITCASPGKDGVGTNITGIVNTYYPGTASASAGGTTLSLGASTGASTQITAGDLLLVMQMQDATLNTADSTAYGSGGTSGSGATAVNAGKYEYVVATSASSGNGSVSIRGDGSGGGLINSYTNSAYSATSGAKRFQVIRVPQYSSATLGATAITAPAWNGSTGGVVGIDVAGTLNLNGGSITTTGLGFRGGGGRALGGAAGGSATAYLSSAVNPYHGQKGEGVAGTPQYVLADGATARTDTAVEGYPGGSSARGAPGNAGGGGTDSNPTANDQNSGGGGGAGGGAGGKGGSAWSSQSPVGGVGGAAVSVAVSQLTLGGGGGAGTTNNATGTPGDGVASSGAAGGGVVMVRAGTVSGTGTVTASGANANNSVLNDGSGGGGAGGSVMIVSPNALPNTLAVTANGGTGGTNTGGGSPHGPGGGGGGGAVVLSGSGPTISIAGGAAGTTSGGGNFGAVAGSVGTQALTVTVSQVPGASATTTCFPNLTVTKTTSTPSRVSSTDTAATYTIRVNNTGGTASGVALSDVLPTPFTYNGATVTPTYSGGATGPANVTGTGTGTAGFGTPGGDTTNSFTLPQGGSLSVTFTVNLNSAVAGTYQNPARVSFTDPTRTGTQTATPGATYTGGSTVGGSNYASTSSTGEDVTITNPPLACTNNFYALLGNNATDTFQTIASLTPSGTVGNPIVASVPASTSTVALANRNAALAVSPDGSRIFVGAGDGLLKVYDVRTGQWVASVSIPGAPRSIRMAVTKPVAANPDGVGYLGLDAQLWSFKTTAPYTVSAPTTINYVDSSGITPAPTIGGSGDFFADSAGNLLLSANPGGTNRYIDTFIIRPNGTASFLGRLQSNNITSDTYGGYATQGGKIYASSSSGSILEVDLAALTVTEVAIANTSRSSTDLASCSYPDLNPVIGVSKTVAKVAGSAGSLVLPGDTLEYTIIVRNSGNISAAEATLQDPIPAGATYVAGSTRLNTAIVSDINGTMPFATPGVIKSPNAANGVLQADSTPTVTTDREATLTFRVTINAGTTSVSNQATATYSDNSTGSAATTSVLSDDPNTLASNDPTVTDTAKPILTVTKTVDRMVALYPNSVNGAEPVPPVLNYTITVTNNGTLAAAGVTLTDVLPANVGTPTVTENGNPVAATQNGQNLTWSVGTLATGSAATRTFRVTVTAPPAPTLRATQPQSALVNSVVASATNAATTPAATATTGTAYTALFKQVHNLGSSPAATPIPATSPAWSSTGTGLPRNVVEYCIDFTNYGSLPLNNYKINDVVPANTTLVAGSLFVKQGNMQVTPSTAYVGATTGVTDGTVTATDGTVTATKTVTATIGTLAINTTGSFCFRATIN
jgi:uncharacterized repeat protein (TIGR01451 family)